MPVYKILKDEGYAPTSQGYREYINLWLSAYQNDIPNFHRYTEYNGKRKVPRERRTLGMPKKICEDWADTLVKEGLKSYQSELQLAQVNIDDVNEIEKKIEGMKLELQKAKEENNPSKVAGIEKGIASWMEKKKTLKKLLYGSN